MPSSISSAPAASGATCPATSRPRAPSGATSTGGGGTGPWTGSTTCSARRSATLEKPYHPRTSASVDSQSVNTTSGGEQRGRDNAKNVNGRKRHIVVDSLGLLLAVLVTAAESTTRRRPELFARLDGQPMSKVRRMYADGKYHNFALYEWVEDACGVGSDDRATPEGCRGLGDAADPVDGRADVRLAGQVPPPEQGPREEYTIVGVDGQVGDDPADGPSSPALGDGARVPLS